MEIPDPTLTSAPGATGSPWCGACTAWQPFGPLRLLGGARRRLLRSGGGHGGSLAGMAEPAAFPELGVAHRATRAVRRADGSVALRKTTRPPRAALCGEGRLPARQ